MGWSGSTYFPGMLTYVKNQFNMESDIFKYTLLDYSVVRRTTLYAAVEILNKTTQQKEVIAFVSLFRFSRYDYMVKDMDESMGPCECSCPARILNLLTPTTSEYANKWRKTCWDNIRKRNFKMEEGQQFVKPGSSRVLTLHKKTKWRGTWECTMESNDPGDANIIEQVYHVTKNYLNAYGYTTPEVAIAMAL